MQEHPGHFWICFWLVLILFQLNYLNDRVVEYIQLTKQIYQVK